MSVLSQDTVSIQLNAIFVSLELSRSTWLVTSLSPGGGEKMSRHIVKGGDIPGLLLRLDQLRSKAADRTGKMYPIIVIQEAGLDGFWIHRCLGSEGIESHVVDAASISTSRRGRRAKTDRIDGEALVRALLAYKRGEPRVCAMVVAPSIEDEDRRRVGRERRSLIAERIRHVNRIKGLLFSQGIGDVEPIRATRRQRLEELQTGDGRPLPRYLKQQIERELDRLELILEQLRTIEKIRDEILQNHHAPSDDEHPMLLQQIRGIGPEFAAMLYHEGFYRNFSNRRQVAAYAGLAPSPWRSGSIDREQGVSKAGNKRLRATMIQLSWLWLRHQPEAELTKWYIERVGENGGRVKRVMIVALARKLLIALWQFVSAGVVPKGAVLKIA